MALDAVLDYLPAPHEVQNKAFSKQRDEVTNEPIEIPILLSGKVED